MDRLLDEAGPRWEHVSIHRPLSEIGAHPLGGQLGPQFFFSSLHLVASRGHGVPHPVTGTAGHLAGRATHLDHQGVGLESGCGLLDGPAHPVLGPQ